MELYEGFILSKKLKRRIHELCGFKNLEHEEKLLRANEILNSVELKQAICHQILGTTFKDVERAMEAVLNERQLTPIQEEELELQQTAPQKFDPDFEFRINQKPAAPRSGRYTTYTREEVAALIAASEAPYEPTLELPPPPVYGTYSREHVEQMVREHFEYLEKEKLKRKSNPS